MTKKSDPSRRPLARTPSAAERPASPQEAGTALETLMPVIAAYPKEKLRRITFDVPRAVSIATAARARIAPLRERLLKETPTTPIEYLDNLPTYAMAAWYAHLAAMPKASTSLDALKTEAATLKTDLLVAAEALAHKGYFSKESIAKIKEGSGYIDLANDNVALAALFTESWSTIQNKTAVEWTQVERAAVVGPELLVALGDKVGFGGSASESERLRAKAVSLFVDVYDELQRAVTYLRWHEDDAKELLPSFYQGGGRRNGVEDESGDADVAPPAAPPAPQPAPA